jgi:hypothetical protein
MMSTRDLMSKHQWRNIQLLYIHEDDRNMLSTNEFFHEHGTPVENIHGGPNGLLLCTAPNLKSVVACME